MLYTKRLAITNIFLVLICSHNAKAQVGNYAATATGGLIQDVPSKVNVSRKSFSSEEDVPFIFTLRNRIAGDVLIVESISALKFFPPSDLTIKDIAPLQTQRKQIVPQHLVWLRAGNDESRKGNVADFGAVLPAQYLHTIDLVRGHGADNYKLRVVATFEVASFGEKKFVSKTVEGIIEIVVQK